MVRAPTLLSALALCAGVALPSGPALAQPSTCQEAQKFMGERQTLIQGLNKSAGKGGKACALVSKMEKMQNQARQQQQQQGGNPFGGGLTGTYKIPQGAL